MFLSVLTGINGPTHAVNGRVPGYDVPEEDDGEQGDQSDEDSGLHRRSHLARSQENGGGRIRWDAS